MSTPTTPESILPPKKMSTTFVSCIFHPTDLDYLDSWLSLNLPMTWYIAQNVYPRFLVAWKKRERERMEQGQVRIYENIRFDLLPLLANETQWYDDSLENLPSERNEEKDTIEHMWDMHSKVLVAYKTAIDNPFETSFFAYIDFDSPRLFDVPSTWTYLREVYGMGHLYVPESEKRVFLPGCWNAWKTNECLYNAVHWRFCGSFFLGTAEAITHFYKQYETFFPVFVKTCNRVLSWEMNFWAYLEANTPWNPVWYAGDHNESMVHVPRVFGFENLSSFPTTDIATYLYPKMTPYRPMSAAFVEYQGTPYLNTRFVNYWIYNSGCYYYPEDEHVIRTYNVCSVLSPSLTSASKDSQESNGSNDSNRPFKWGPKSFVVMKDAVTLPKRPDVFSEGLEDIRLYVSEKTGELCFIGCSLEYSYCDRIRMVRGIYDVQTHTLRNAQVIRPHVETWCEKNWAPIPLPNGEDGFVYKWFPLEIGKVNEEVGQDEEHLGKFEVVISREMDNRFRGMKGSTSFVPYGKEGYIGVVHFSEERAPRQYFHRVVVLHRETYGVVKCSPAFCFRKAWVEFCIGFRSMEEGSMWGFWISQMDRDPLYLETSAFWEEEFEL
jgi:hypothetical protein